MSGDQIPSLPGKKRCRMPGVCPGVMLKLRFDWYIKVIPLKLFHYKTFFENWRNEHSWYEHYKNAIKKWGHRACVCVSRVLKWGTFTGCALKVRITSISSIASFKPFLIAWLWECCTFSDSSVVNFKSWPWPKYTQLATISQKISCSTIKLFLLFKYVLH